MHSTIEVVVIMLACIIHNNTYSRTDIRHDTHITGIASHWKIVQYILHVGHYALL